MSVRLHAEQEILIRVTGCTFTRCSVTTCLRRATAVGLYFDLLISWYPVFLARPDAGSFRLVSVLNSTVKPWTGSCVQCWFWAFRTCGKASTLRTKVGCCSCPSVLGLIYRVLTCHTGSTWRVMITDCQVRALYLSLNTLLLLCFLVVTGC